VTRRFRFFIGVRPARQEHSQHPRKWRHPWIAPTQAASAHRITHSLARWTPLMWNRASRGLSVKQNANVPSFQQKYFRTGHSLGRRT